MYVVWQPRRGTSLAALGLFLAVSAVLAGRGPAGTLSLAVPNPLVSAAEDIATAYTAARPEAQVDLLPVEGEGAAAELVRSGAAEAALIPGPPGAVERKGAERPDPGRAGRLSLLHVGWEAVAVVTGPFTPTGDLSLSQVTALLSGEQVSWGAVVQGVPGTVRLYWPSGNGALPLLAEHLRLRGRRLRPGKVVGSLRALREALLADPSGLSFLPADQVPPGLNLVRVGGALPEPDSVLDGRYPLARPLFLAVPGRPSAGARALARLARRRWDPGERRTAHIVLGGDFLPDGPVGEAIRAKGPEWPWAKLAPLTAAADLAVCNLEAPLSDLGWRINEYRGEPCAVKGLVAAGIDAVSLANDHILDYDDPALLSTLALLDREGIAHAGAGSTLDHARRPAVLQAGGTKVALLAYGRPELGRSRTGRRWDASPWSPGIAPAAAELVVEDVRRAAQAAQTVLVAVHWGEDQSETPRPEDRQLARLAIDAGADVVFGHGGRVRGLEVYGRGLILYGLGPLVRQDEDPADRLGLAAVLSLSGGRVAGLELIPLWNERAQPAIQDRLRRVESLRLLHERSRRLASAAFPSGAGNATPAPYSGDGGGPSRERREDNRVPQLP